jgi:hypothetical protein
VPFVRHIGATSYEHYPEPFQRPVKRDYRIPLNSVFGDRSDIHTVEIAKDVMPTIGLHAIRLPSGSATVVSGTVRVAIGAVHLTVAGTWCGCKLLAMQTGILLAPGRAVRCEHALRQAAARHGCHG